ncbi:hypothetical protein EVAR_8021_1 [Eumeta japonica]|uniref:Uncharacterized protein n=1 Tax=Eumeta variegata TaxID=151549 RepID=A0A4C1TI60_EUMVA|nr:hypothetical protein EVAR_8021_1 [Eumeta japonica]
MSVVVGLLQPFSTTGAGMSLWLGSGLRLVGEHAPTGHMISDFYLPYSACLDWRFIPFRGGRYRELISTGQFIVLRRQVVESLAIMLFLTYHPSPAIIRSTIFCWAWSLRRCCSEDRAVQHRSDGSGYNNYILLFVPS